MTPLPSTITRMTSSLPNHCLAYRHKYHATASRHGQAGCSCMSDLLPESDADFMPIDQEMYVK